MAYKNKVISNPVTGQSIRFLQTSCDTNGELLEMESTFAPHSIEPLPHYHPKQHETFTVLHGSIRVRIKDRIYELKAGEQLEIPAKTVQSMWNAAAEKAVVNWKVEPAYSTEYFLETGMALAAHGKVNAKGLPSILQTALLMRYYNKVFRLARPTYLLQKIIFGLLKPISQLAGYKAVYKEYID
ncbi:MAG TPA: cupin domain-containing protein [Flavisolibacter sp.]|nr:cupin domain-containing protein [Flavisolibacter sp.]